MSGHGEASNLGEKSKVEVWLSPSDQVVRSSSLKSDTACVVVDVLRATTSMVVALANGARAIIPVASVTEAVLQKTRQPEVFLAGERGGLKIRKGSDNPFEFDFGNSPSEFLDPKVRGREVVMTTTNGTVAVRHCLRAGSLLVAAMVNLSATVRHLKIMRPGRLVFVAAGTGEEPALEDVTVIGCMLSELTSANSLQFELVGDAPHLALLTYKAFGGDVLKAFERSQNGRRLIALGLQEDLMFAARRDLFEVVAGATKQGVIVRM